MKSKLYVIQWMTFDDLKGNEFVSRDKFTAKTIYKRLKKENEGSLHYIRLLKQVKP